MDRRKIAKEYLRWWFWIDFVSNLDVAGAMSLLKMLRLARFPRLFVRWANLGVSTMALNLFKISILTLTAGHFLACAFFAVADHEKHTDDNWTRKDFGEYTLFEEVEVSCNGTIPGSDAGFDITSPQGVCLEVQVQQNLLTVYIASLYFAYATLTTVGYGDIAATTTSERAIALVALTVGSAIFAGIVGMMSQLLETMDELEELKLKKLKHIQQFIKSHHFPDATKDRIRRYVREQTERVHAKRTYESSFAGYPARHAERPPQSALVSWDGRPRTRPLRSPFICSHPPRSTRLAPLAHARFARRYYDLHFLYLKKELDMLNELSPALRHECMHHIYARILEKVPFLRDSPQIIQSTVIASVTPILCCEKDYLVIEGQVLNHMFLVASGAVEVINNKGLVVRTYGVGSFFGEKCAFHAHYLSAVSYRAKVDLEVLTIERAVFVDILNTYEEFAETFVMICQKREEHKKGGDGSSKMTSKLAKSAESMVRPVTPPPGTTWKKPINGSVHENQHRETSFYSKDDEKRRSRSGPHVSEFFEDNSVPALLDKLQYNLTMQIDEVMDHLEDVEDRLDEMEDGEESDEDIWGGDSSAARDAMLVGQNSLLEIQKQIGEEEGGGGGETPPPPTGVGGGVGGESAFVGVIPGQMEFTETEEDTKCLSLEEAAKAAESSVRKSPKPMGRRITSSPPRAAVKRASGISTEQSTVPELQRFESRRKQRMERKTHDKSTKQIRHERRESNRFRKLHSERHLNGGSPHEF